IRSLAAGQVAAVVLLSSAAMKDVSAKTYQIRFPGKSRNFSQANVAEKYSSAESTFFRSVAHATVSTSTGCTAQIAAATQPPGTASRRRTIHSSTTLTAFNNTLTR